MKLTILGSGGVLGVPVWSCKCDICTKAVKRDKRNIRTRPSLLITTNNKKIVIDMGPDFRRQMLREEIKKIHYVLITHSHGDHTASLNELRACDNTILEVPAKVYKEMKKSKNVFKYIKKRNPKITIRHFKPHKIGNLSVDTITVKHEKDFTQKIFHTFGYLFVENNQRVAYIPDFGQVVEKDKVKDLDIFICDGAHLKSKWGHVGIEGGLKLYKELKPKLMLFTHLTHYMSHKNLEKYISKFGNIKPAYDGLTIEI